MRGNLAAFRKRWTWGKDNSLLECLVKLLAVVLNTWNLWDSMLYLAGHCEIFRLICYPSIVGYVEEVYILL
jgi:hypothetical protein